MPAPVPCPTGAGSTPKSKMTWKEARPNQRIIGDITNKHIFNNLINLVGEVIQGGLNEYGEEYIDDINGQFWFDISNIDKSYIRKKYRLLAQKENKTLKNRKRR